MKKRFLWMSTSIMATAAPIATVISCTSEQASALENHIKSLITGGDIKVLAQEKLFSTIIDSEFKRLKISGVEKEKRMELAWNIFALNQMKSSSNYWVSQVNSLVANGTINKPDFTSANWIPALETTGAPSGNIIKDGYFPSYTIAKKIMKEHPTLGWKLMIEKLLVAELYLTTVEWAELYAKDEIKDYLSDKNHKQADKDKIKKMAGNWYKKRADLPSSISREPKTIGAKSYGENYFFLTEYLVNKKPQLVWNKTAKNRAISHAGANLKLNSFDDFNKVNRQQKNLLAPKMIFTKNILELSGANKSLISKLEGFNGFTTPMISDKGDVDTSPLGIEKRLADNMSKSGFLNEDGKLLSTNGEVIVKNGQVTAQYVQQFLPHFIAFNIRSVYVKHTASDKGNASVIDRSNGIHISAEYKNGKFVEAKYNNTDNYMKVDLAKAKTPDIWESYIYLEWKNGKVSKAWLGGKDQQLITNPDDLEHIEKGDKSFYYADSNLLKDKDKLRSLLFQFALSDPSIISNSLKFMVNVRSYELNIKNPKTKEALKGLGLWKED